MSITALPWFMAVEHANTTDGSGQLIGPNSFDSISSGEIVTSAALGGRRCLRVAKGGTARIDLDSAVTEIVLGFAMTRDGSDGDIITLADSGGATLCKLYLTQAFGPGVLRFIQGSTTVWTGSVAPAAGDYFELSVKLRTDLTGAFAVRVNGVEHTSQTLLCTAGNANGVSQILYRGGGSSLGSTYAYYTDLYVRERVVVDDESFYGPPTLTWLPVDADVSANMTPLTGPTNYTELDDPIRAGRRHVLRRDGRGGHGGRVRAGRPRR